MNRGAREQPSAPGKARWAGLILAVALTLPATSRAAVEIDGPITQIQVRGNTSIPAEQIRAKIASRPGRPLDRKTVESDLKKLLATKWFSDVRPKYYDDPKGKGFVLVFDVTEMPILRAVEFRGRNNWVVRLKELEESTGLKVGARADHLTNLMAVNKIKQLYEEKGYELVEVKLLEGGKHGDTRAIFQIFEGPKCRVSGIAFEGNTFSTDATLKTKISSRPALIAGLGGHYRAEDVDEDARKLEEYYQAHGFFEADVRPVKRQGSSLGKVDLTFVISEGPQYKVRNVVFEGNEKVATAALRDGLKLHSGEAYSDLLRDADRKTLETRYGSIGCIDAEIVPEWRDIGKRGVVDLVYKIKEGEPYRVGRIIVQGNERTQSRVLLREAAQAGLVPGEPLDINRVNQYKQRLSNLKYFQVDPQLGRPLDVKLVNRRPADKPYADPVAKPDLNSIIRTRLQSAEPDSPPPSPPAEGDGPSVTPFGAGSTFDPPPTDLPPISAPIAPGPPPELPAPPPAEVGREPKTPPLGAGELPGTFPSLPGANMFDVGPDRQEPYPNRSYADIVTQVDEGPTGRVMLGVGANSYSGLSGTFILHESNFDLFAFPRSLRDFGTGRAFRGAGQDFRIELSPGTQINRAVVSFRDPYLFDLPIGLGLSGYTFERIYADFTEARGGGRFSLGRQLGTQTYVDAAFRIEDVNFTAFQVPAPAEYLAASGHTTLATLRPSIRFDNRNDPFKTVSGQYLEAAFEQGWGDFTFPKFTVEGRQYLKTGSRPDGSGVRFLTFRGFFGVTGRDTPVYERFYAGDFRSMRGFSYRGVGPRSLGLNVGGLMTAIGSVEYQFPWTASDTLQQVVFADFGTVEAGYDFHTFRAAVGTGLRVYLPERAFGPLPLAFDIAFPVTKEDGDRTRVFTFFIGAFW